MRDEESSKGVLPAADSRVSGFVDGIATASVANLARGRTRRAPRRRDSGKSGAGRLRFRREAANHRRDTADEEERSRSGELGDGARMHGLERRGKGCSRKEHRSDKKRRHETRKLGGEPRRGSRGNGMHSSLYREAEAARIQPARLRDNGSSSRTLHEQTPLQWRSPMMSRVSVGSVARCLLRADPSSGLESATPPRPNTLLFRGTRALIPRIARGRQAARRAA